MASEWLDNTPIEIPFYCLCLTPEDYRAKCAHLGIKDEEVGSFLPDASADAATHHFVDGRKRTCIVTLRRGTERTPIQIACLLVHEAVHIWQAVEDKMGTTGGEFEAYHIQAISQNLMVSYVEQTTENA